MRLILINFVMAIFSLFFIGFGCWAYYQSVYDEQVRKNFQEKQITPINKLKEAALLSDKLVLVKASE